MTHLAAGDGIAPGLRLRRRHRRHVHRPRGRGRAGGAALLQAPDDARRPGRWPARRTASGRRRPRAARRGLPRPGRAASSSARRARPTRSSPGRPPAPRCCARAGTRTSCCSARAAAGRRCSTTRRSTRRPYVPRSLTFEVPERLTSDGTVARPLDEDAVRAIARQLVRARGRGGRRSACSGRS